MAFNDNHNLYFSLVYTAHASAARDVKNVQESQEKQHGRVSGHLCRRLVETLFFESFVKFIKNLHLFRRM